MNLVPMFVVAVAVGVATVTDLRYLKVYNWLTFPLLAAGLTFHAAREGWGGLGLALTNVLIVFAILLVPFVLGALGAGDVKLVTALAAWLGTETTFTIAAIALFATAAYSLFMLVRQGRLSDTWWSFKLSLVRMTTLDRHMGSEEDSIHEMAATPEGRARLVPFSVMVAVGTITSILWQLWQTQS